MVAGTSADRIEPAACGPGYRLFTAGQLEQIHLSALEVLRRTGVRVLEDESRQLLQEAGCTVTDGTRVRFPAAVVEDGVRILSNQIASQVEIHARYGGIVPEVASRQHILSIIPILGDVTNQRELNKIFATYKPQVVFHAAAFKHVPIVELNPWAGVVNNILGTKNIVEASHRFNTERFVMISTDKAVRPTNVMGATKRVAEMLDAEERKVNRLRMSCSSSETQVRRT
jgi:FlaA1/EpsC-like NDP-sugar epimerase